MSAYLRHPNSRAVLWVVVGILAMTKKTTEKRKECVLKDVFRDISPHECKKEAAEKRGDGGEEKISMFFCR